jgi:hypothetical protein
MHTHAQRERERCTRKHTHVHIRTYMCSNAHSYAAILERIRHSLAPSPPHPPLPRRQSTTTHELPAPSGRRASCAQPQPLSHASNQISSCNPHGDTGCSFASKAHDGSSETIRNEQWSCACMPQLYACVCVHATAVTVTTERAAGTCTVQCRSRMMLTSMGVKEIIFSMPRRAAAVTLRSCICSGLCRHSA